MFSTCYKAPTKKSTTNIKLSNKKLGAKQQYLLSPLLLNTVMEVLGSAIGPLLLEKPYTLEMKTKLFIFADDMIVSVENF